MCLKNVADCPRHESGSSFLTLFWRSSLWESMFASGWGENGSADTVNNNGYTVLNAHTYSLYQVHKVHCSMDCLTPPVKLGLFSPFYRQKNWGLEWFDYPLAVQLMRGGRPWFWLCSFLPLSPLPPFLSPSLPFPLPPSFFLIAGGFIGKSCFLVLRFIALCKHIYIYMYNIFLNKLKACSKSSSNKSISTIFPVAFFHFVSMSYLVFLAIFEPFHYFYIHYGDL